MPTSLHNQDRIVTLEVMEGKKPLNSGGQYDPRLFSGENKIRLTCDETSMWGVKYDYGVTPATLQQKFTSSKKLMEYLKEYYKKRNIEAKEVA